MLRTVLIVGSLVAIASGQSCNPLKITSPCEAGLPCQTGSTCDTVLGSCCLDADLITSTAATGTSSTTISSGSTVTSRTTTRTSSTSCVDKVNPATGTSDCAKNKALCNDSNYYDVMTQQCAKTCGRCSSTSSTVSGSCVDLTNPRTGTSDCATLRAYCNDSNYQQLMRTQCPRTCGFCGSSTGSSSTATVRTSTVSSGSCVDKVNPATGRSDCSSNRALCNNSAYQSVMRAQCPRTCGFC